MAVVTYRMPTLDIEVEVNLEKYLPEDKITKANVNTQSMKVILEEAVRVALKNKTVREQIGAFLSCSVFMSVKCKSFTVGHILPSYSFTKPLKLKI